MIRRILPLIAAVLVGLAMPAGAKPAEPSTTAASSDEEAYTQFLAQKTTRGPAQIAVRSQAVLDLPEGYAFLPEKTAREFMTKLGNRTGEDFVGLVLPGRDEGWFVIVEYNASGYVKDDDAKNWNADDLLKDIRNNTNEQNIERRRNKIPELDVVGWVETPRYDETTHRLIWSVAAREKGTPEGAPVNINYRTLMLGREGYVAMNLITTDQTIAADKGKVQTLLAHLQFNDKKRYGDFNASTDKIAEYGLAALIGGIAVKKLGLFALIGAFLLKSIKFVAIAVIGVFAWMRRGFRKKEEEAPVEPVFKFVPPEQPEVRPDGTRPEPPPTEPGKVE